MISRRSLLTLALLAATPVMAQDYPARSPTIVVPFAAGGPFDIIGREVAEVLSQKLNRRFNVENRPGAGGVAGTRFVMSAPADGYTLLIGSPGPLVIAPSANPGKLDIEGKLQPIGVVSESPQVLVVSEKVPAKSISELAALIKQKPGTMNYGSAGIGTTPHLSAELFKNVAGLDIQHVPYRGTSAAMQDLLRGEISLMFGDIATLRPFIESGKLRALAVTGAVRSKLVPQVPTAAEAGFPRLVVRNFSVLLAPAGLPDGIAQTLSKALGSAQKDDAFVSKMTRLGMTTVDSSPQQAREFLQKERETWAPLIRTIGLKPSL